MSPPTFRPFCGQPYVRIKYAMYSSESTSAVWRGTFVLYPRQNSVFQSICLNGQVTIVSYVCPSITIQNQMQMHWAWTSIVKLCLGILGRCKPNESLKEASTENHWNNQNRPTTRASYPPAKRISMYIFTKNLCANKDCARLVRNVWNMPRVRFILRIFAAFYDVTTSLICAARPRGWWALDGANIARSLTMSSARVSLIIRGDGQIPINVRKPPRGTSRKWYCYFTEMNI